MAIPQHNIGTEKVSDLIDLSFLDPLHTPTGEASYPTEVIYLGNPLQIIIFPCP